MTALPSADAATQLRMYETMVTIRAFEERVTGEFRRGRIPGFVHAYSGEEGIAAGVCAALRDDDWIASTHRGHGHCIAKGSDLRAIFAEIAGRSAGLCRGRGGSMHVADVARGMLGANAIVGGGIALATGAALAAQVREEDRVAVAFFGDGAANQGVLHESLNLAAIWRLPVLYVCENNGWAESTPVAYATSTERIADRAAGYRIPGVTVDASNVLDVFTAASDAVSRARSGGGPTLVECRVRRFAGHYVGDPQGYRNEDPAAFADHDPITLLAERLLASGATEQDLVSIRARIDELVDEAIAYGLGADWPSPSDLTSYVYASKAVR